MSVGASFMIMVVAMVLVLIAGILLTHGYSKRNYRQIIIFRSVIFVTTVIVFLILWGDDFVFSSHVVADDLKHDDMHSFDFTEKEIEDHIWHQKVKEAFHTADVNSDNVLDAEEQQYFK
eukprot:CAMPEP_0176375890 /NCGR_PEP_ID=MMETSP0126-20121128/27811_1 /TAXON_ID=141414 ORGANISM="Strombidinopsis acuminatum, Strain SPMC142" /NCGR_SAMPLE_ID=MMETSP0126 /ASSEMBLY_ACC=CAM_ASM_000229 /LENGTH=118 /DNA_ID=CAMNT_0017737121 /DNA_START=306 /DNA_END=662 /DNA_ORIENTATION=-